MTIDTVPLNELTEADLRVLQDNAVPEGQRVDYKLMLNVNSSGEKKEFLCDVTSFANTAGGHLIYGVREREMIPISLDGIELADKDRTIQQVENLLRDGIDPRLPSCGVKIVDLSNGKFALVLRIPRSPLRPHMVTADKAMRFYARNNAGKYPMSTSELRTQFVQSEELGERIRRFRLERLSLLRSDDPPVTLERPPGPPVGPPQPLAVFHAVPFDAFAPGQQINWSAVIGNGPVRLIPFSCDGCNRRYNADGYLSYRGERRGPPRAYLQLFRNGIVESVDTSSVAPETERQLGKRQRIGATLERDLIRAVNEYRRDASFIGVDMPYAVMFSLLHVRDYCLGMRSDITQPIDRNDLIFPEVVLYRPEQKTEEVLQPIFDALWNAAGFPFAPPLG